MLGKPSRVDLIRQIDELKRHSGICETKLKDVVRAYRSLSSEKEALEKIVEQLSTSNEAAPQSSETSHLDTTQIVAETDERRDVLKRSIATLIAEKNRRENAIQADKKALLVENEALKEKLQKSAEETEVQAEKLEQQIKELNQKMKRIEEDREKELDNNGAVLAELQQRYSKERTSNDKLKKQLAELYQKLHEKDAKPIQMESKMTELTAQLGSAQAEIDLWKEKSKKTLTARILESELQNLRISSQREIDDIKSKLSTSIDLETELRMHKLEQRIADMSLSLANLKRSQIDDHHKIEELTKLNERLQNENSRFKKMCFVNSQLDDSADKDEIKKKIMELLDYLKEKDSEMDVFDFLNFERPSSWINENKQISRGETIESSSSKIDDPKKEPVNLISSQKSLLIAECTSCISAQVERRRMSSIVAALQDKIQTIEIDHANSKNDYEEKCTSLQRTIVEMQVMQSKTINELRQQMHYKVSEMELEMQKQRTRTLEVIEEKENELEVARAFIVSVRNQHHGISDPVDPSQEDDRRIESEKHLPVSRTASMDKKRISGSYTNDGRKFSEADSYSSAAEDYRPLVQLSEQTDRRYSLACTASAPDAKNVFYEQQLAIKEKMILGLRNSLEEAESQVREMQQSSMTKDLQYYEIIEKLKDEIRILEGKLNFCTSDANMEYLRNVFIQLLNCDNSSKRVHILKAIGTVLKLSSVEMRNVDKHNAS